MFGQTGNPSFGFTSTTQNSPFGQSTFGKTIASSFGTSAPPVFGNSTSLFSAKPTGSTPGSLFGNTTSTSTFGAGTATQSSFGGFGNANTTTPLFGAQPSTSTNLFGTNNATPAFGQTNKSTTFGFNQSTSAGLFGQPQQTAQQQTTPFGQSASSGNTNLFGTNSGFNNTNSASGISGTVVKFNPVNGTDTMVKNGVTQTISTRHHCITCMKEYEAKSLEELRLEDYSAGRKGVNQGQTSTIFGTVSQNSPFGTVSSNSNNANSGFGTISTGFGSTGQTGTSSLFSKPISGFGVPATTTSAFAFNSTTTSSLFNNQTKPFGATSSSLFAAGNTAPSSGNTFGNINTQNTGFGSNFNSAQSNQSIGLFTQNKSAFNMPSSNSTTTFGFGQNSTTNTGSLFSSKQTGTGYGTGFGTTNSNSFQSGTGGFGSSQNTNTSLFNNTFKTAGQPGGFTFGNATNTVTGGLGTSGTSVFNTSTKPSLFGNTSASTTFNTSGTFGTMPTFGTNTNTIPTVGTNLHGTGICLNNIHHSSGSVPVHQQILALVSAPFGDSPLLKNLLPASGKSEQFLKPSNPSKGLNNSNYKVVTANPSTKAKPKLITDIPLSKKSLFDGLEEEDPLFEAFQPRPNAKRLVLRPKSITSNECSIKSSKNEKCIQNMNEVINRSTDKENDIQDHNKMLNNRRTSNSWLKSSFPRNTNNREDEYTDLQNSVSKTSELTLTEDELENTVSELRSPLPLENRTTVPINLSAKNNKESCTTSSANENDSTHENMLYLKTHDTTSSALVSDESGNLANIKLQRYGYYTIPSLEMLHKYVENNTCIVPHFTIGRSGYGNVYFADSFDIFGLDLDEIVYFRHKEVIIYPDDNMKPSIGQGLNRKAQVTLDRVWPLDKSSHEPITDPKRLIEMDYEGKLRRVSAKHGTRFLEYRPETGSWVFKVDHFSKYGLSDSDDDENEINTNRDLKKIKNSTNTEKDFESFIKRSTQAISYLESQSSTSDSTDIAQSNCKIHQRGLTCDNGKHNMYSPTLMHARITGAESHTLQLMKADFFEITDDDLMLKAISGSEKKLFEKNQNTSTNLNLHKSLADRDNLMKYSMYQSTLCPNYSLNLNLSDITVNNIQNLTKIKDMKSMNLEMRSTSFVAPSVRPKVAILKFKSGIAPLSHGIGNHRRSKYSADIGVQMGKVFKPSWSPLMTLISLSTQEHASNISLRNSVDQLDFYITGHRYDDFSSSSIVQRLKIFGGSSLENDYIQLFKSSIEGHLKIQLQCSKLGEQQECPIVNMITGEANITALNAHEMCSSRTTNNSENNCLMNYFSDVWRLCVSLWGKLSNTRAASSNTNHETIILRKEALSEWLKHVTLEKVEQEIAQMESNDQIILSLLSANKLEEACDQALISGDHCLALLLSQLSGTFTVRELLKQQLELWQETDVDENFCIHRLKLFMLAAGVPIISKRNEIINLFENLDWKRTLAIYLWYISLPVASIMDSVDLYESSLLGSKKSSCSSYPSPDYMTNEFHTESNCGSHVYDLCYHLIKLYCSGNYPLEAMLNPQTYTYDPLDYRLSWLIHQTVNALGYTHSSEHVTALIHTNFAAQLETFDCWHWSIFVLLHLKNSDRRRRSVIDLLLRHVELDRTLCYAERERFLKEKLRIPMKWINEAKAIKSRALKNYGEAAWYYIHAEDWNKAHDIIMEHLATEALINENHDYLKSLLNSLTPSKCVNTISEWMNHGQLILDYIIVTTEIEQLLDEEHKLNVKYKLELLQPQLASLCSKISTFPCPTSKHRLCQAEMAKRTLQLARSLLMLHPKEKNASDFLVNLIFQLPLPEDYAQQELRPIINISVNEIVS